MGAYLSHPVTDKEVYSGSNKFLEYGGASMQGWRRTMEDAHIAVLDLEDRADTAIFGVFDGHGGSEVAKFCQKYMAEEITKLARYHQGKIQDSLVEVFHKIDYMLKDEAYSKVLASLKENSPPTQMPAEEDSTPNGEIAPAKKVSTAEAMQLIRKVLAMGQRAGEGNARSQEASSSGQEFIAESIGGDPAIESVGAGSSEAGVGAALREDPPAESIQAGCTALVAVFQGDQLYVANAGDSRAVLCRGPDAVALSEDHKPASESEKNRIMAAGGWVSSVHGVNRVNGNLNLSRAIGDLRYKTNSKLSAADQIISAQPDVTQTQLTRSDWFLVLACDGVWDVMTNQEVVNFVGQKLTTGIAAADIASQLLDACLADNPAETRGIGCDNMTATIVVLRRHMDAAVHQDQ